MDIMDDCEINGNRNVFVRDTEKWEFLVRLIARHLIEAVNE